MLEATSLPSHCVPFPFQPSLHLHANVPCVLKHMLLAWHLGMAAAHSSMSERKRERERERERERPRQFWLYVFRNTGTIISQNNIGLLPIKHTFSKQKRNSYLQVPCMSLACIAVMGSDHY